MPLLTLHLIRLRPDASRDGFLQELMKDRSTDIVVASLPRFLVVRAQKTDATKLSDTAWDLMLLVKTSSGNLPDIIESQIREEYKVCVGVPSKLLSNYPEKNKQLLRNASSASLTGSLDRARVPDSSQDLELSPELLKFMDELTESYGGPTTMLNLLHFEQDGKPSYYKYGQGFINVNSKRGGDAKIVGNVVRPPNGQSDSRGDMNRAETSWWNEIAIVHYPSIRHFCDMLAGEDYQKINHQYRLPALHDTFLLCTTEIDLKDLRAKAKL